MSSENTGSMYNNSGSAPSRHRPSYDNGLRLSGPSSSRANSRATGQSRDQDKGHAQRQTRSQNQGENPSAGPSARPSSPHHPNQNRHQNGMNNNTPRQGRARPDREENTGTMLDTYLNECQAQYQKYAPDPTASVEKSQRNHIAEMTDILAALELSLPRDQ